MTTRSKTAIKGTKRRFKIKGFWLISIISLIGLSAVYMYQVNAITGQAYKVSVLNREAKQMAQDNESLEGKIVQQQGLTSQTANSLNLERIVKIEYVNLAKPVVAAR